MFMYQTLRNEMWLVPNGLNRKIIAFHSGPQPHHGHHQSPRSGADSQQAQAAAAEIMSAAGLAAMAAAELGKYELKLYLCHYEKVKITFSNCMAL